MISVQETFYSLIRSTILHDLDYSEVVLMPGDNVEADSVEQISRRLKDMTVSGIYYLCDSFKQFLTMVLINSWRLMY